MSQPILDNWIGSQPIFLLEIIWNGKEYRISSEPITVSSSFGDQTYTGGLLEDPDLVDDLGQIGFDVSSKSTSISLIFQSVNVLKEIMRGNTLQGAECELSYVLNRQGTIQNYEQRTQLIKGQLKQPVYGHVDRPVGYVEFSIESQVFDGSLYSFQTGDTARLNTRDLSSLTNTTISPFSSKYIGGTPYITLYESHQGKKLPIVFGDAGVMVDPDGNTINYALSPCYIIAINNSAPFEVWIGIASHFVKSSQVRIIDDDGLFVQTDVKHWIRSDNQVFAYCNFELKPSLVFRLKNPIDNAGVQYYCSWREGGGLVSKTRDHTITGGGELCLYLLTLGRASIDFEAWIALSPLLDEYEFAGYIDEDSISPLVFIEQEIIPLLPISVIHGNEGLKPILDLFSSSSSLYVKYDIKQSTEFRQSSPVSTITDSSDVVNHFTLQYAYDSKQNRYLSIMRITPDPLITHNYQFSNADSQLSAQKYGVMKDSQETKYVIDDSTASRICFDRVRMKGATLRTVEYQASPRYGYVQIGDILNLTDTNLFEQTRKVQVIRRVWNDNFWLFTLKIDDYLTKDNI